MLCGPGIALVYSTVMVNNLDIRDRRASDTTAIEALYPTAFPEEDLLPLIRSLDGSPETASSMVALHENSVVAHVIFTQCALDDQFDPVVLLGPLVVDVNRHKQGIGSCLVNAGLERMRTLGVSLVFVLGDPDYYQRFGFSKESSVMPPYPLNPRWLGAWQSLELHNDVQRHGRKLVVPEQWSKPSLWM